MNNMKIIINLIYFSGLRFFCLLRAFMLEDNGDSL